MIVINHRTHRVGGLAAGAITASIVSPELQPTTVAIVVISSFLGSYFPDIDEPSSRIGKKFPLLSRGLKRIFRHRGVVHTPVFCIALLLLLRFLLIKLLPVEIVKNIVLGFCVGYFSHLFLDTITPKGIMWFWPITDKYISTQSENFVKFLIVLGSALYFYLNYNLAGVVERLFKF